MDVHFTTELPTIVYNGKELDLYDSDALRKRLNNKYWLAITDNLKLFKDLTDMAYETISIGEGMKYRLETRQNYRCELVGSIRALFIELTTIASIIGEYASTHLPTATYLYMRGLLYLVMLSVLAGIYDDIKVYEGYADGFYYIAVYFNDFPIEDIIRKELAEFKELVAKIVVRKP